MLKFKAKIDKENKILQYLASLQPKLSRASNKVLILPTPKMGKIKQ